MDVKEMCGYLRLKADLLASHDTKNYNVSVTYREIADYIEQQAKRITELESQVAQRTGQLNYIKNSGKFDGRELAEYFLAVTPMKVPRALSNIQELERYAELGRLAIADFKENMDNIRDFTDKNEANMKFIGKRSEVYKSERAELLKVKECW